MLSKATSSVCCENTYFLDQGKELRRNLNWIELSISRLKYEKKGYEKTQTVERDERFNSSKLVLMK